MCNKYDDMLIEIQNFFNKYDIKFKLHYLKRDDMYRIIIQSKEQLKILFNLLYNNSTLFLSRKKEKFENYVNTELLHKTNENCNA